MKANYRGEKPPPYESPDSSVEPKESPGAGSAPTTRERIRYNLDVLLPKLALPIAILVGSGITAGTTYALIRRVQHLIATARVSEDLAKWMQEARTKAYDPCYLGCDDSSAPSCVASACAKTATANVTGVICDGNLMWNWKERYPLECLEALGEDYKRDALKALKQSYRNQLAIIMLTVLAGVIGGWVVYKRWNTVMRRRRERAEEMRLTAQEWPRFFHSAPGILAFCSVGKVAAYACTGYDPSFDQYFVNSNRTIFGLIHGWLSNCHDKTICSTTCTSMCSGIGTGCGQSCTMSCTTLTFSDKAPVAFVKDIEPSVTDCGFEPVDAVEGDVNVRVANVGIEKNWWVKISVNGYNVTSLTDTDEAVFCLHNIGDV